MFRVPALRLALSEAPWPLAVDRAADIDQHFARRRAANPAFYDGRVGVLRDVWEAEGSVGGLVSLERFSAFLYWRDGLGSDAAVLDGFATALVLSAEGHVLAVRAAEATLNAGRVYLPGGFIDERDITATGLVDIDGSVARELAEETGLDAAALDRVPGYIVTRLGRHCSFCVAFRARLDTDALREQMLSGIARDRDRELADVIAMRDEDDLARHEVLDHARLLMSFALGVPGFALGVPV